MKEIICFPSFEIVYFLFKNCILESHGSPFHLKEVIIIPLCRQANKKKKKKKKNLIVYLVSSVCMDDTYFKQFRWGKSVLLNGKIGFDCFAIL